MSEPYNVYQDIRQFVSFDAAGRIISSGSQGLGFIQEMQARGERIAFGGVGESRLDTAERYVDVTTSEPTVKPRETLVLPVTTFTLAPRVPAVLVGLSKATISYAGPVSGKVEHMGGDLGLGFALPGRYVVTIEAFPRKPAQIVIEVRT